MKIYVVGSSKNKFLPLDNIRKKFLIDQKHDGDNIDFLNPWYCELTGLYYLWKHVNDDIVGLEHYRRYFGKDVNRPINEKEILDILKHNDVIVDKYSFKGKHYSGWIQNENMGRISEIKKCLMIVKHFYPEVYDSIYSYLHEHDVIEGNMFICHKKLIDEYCAFIFDVLKIYVETEKDFNRKLIPRICGYIAEYFFGGWLKYKQLKLYDNKRLYLSKDLSLKKFGEKIC